MGFVKISILIFSVMTKAMKHHQRMRDTICQMIVVWSYGVSDMKRMLIMKRVIILSEQNLIYLHSILLSEMINANGIFLSLFTKKSFNYLYSSIRHTCDLLNS